MLHSKYTILYTNVDYYRFTAYPLHVHTKFYLYRTLILYNNSEQDGIRQFQTAVRFRGENGVLSISKCQVRQTWELINIVVITATFRGWNSKTEKTLKKKKRCEGCRWAHS